VNRYLILFLLYVFTHSIVLGDEDNIKHFVFNKCNISDSCRLIYNVELINIFIDQLALSSDATITQNVNLSKSEAILLVERTFNVLVMESNGVVLVVLKDSAKRDKIEFVSLNHKSDDSPTITSNENDFKIEKNNTVYYGWIDQINASSINDDRICKEYLPADNLWVIKFVPQTKQYLHLITIDISFRNTMFKKVTFEENGIYYVIIKKDGGETKEDIKNSVKISGSFLK